jgi:molybdenum cofactor guanylyltransferase
LRFEGPMAGLLAGLKASKTPWLATVPCDSPFFPLNLVERLLGVARQQGTSLAVAATQGNEGVALQPVFLLMQAEMQASLAQHLRSGRRRLNDWLIEQKASQVLFDQPDAFANANSLDDLGDLTRKAGRP